MKLKNDGIKWEIGLVAVGFLKLKDGFGGGEFSFEIKQQPPTNQANLR